MPGRIVAHKRPLLAVAGGGAPGDRRPRRRRRRAPPPGRLEALEAAIREHGLERRVTLIARRIGEDEKAELIARSLAVVHIPFDENYAYVTLEAMHARKAVITCADSGATLEFVADGESGLVVAPEPAALAGAIDRLRADPAEATRLGARGAQLLAAAGARAGTA